MLKPDVLINKNKNIYVPDKNKKQNKDKYNISGKCIKIIK